jgi:hypothetical protein
MNNTYNIKPRVSTINLGAFLVFFSLLPIQLSSVETSQQASIEENWLRLKLNYGGIFFLPSLLANSNLEFSSENSYSDIFSTVNIKISENITYSGLLQLSNQPHTMIGTKLSRPDFPLSTGRIQESKIDFQGKSFKVSLGRANFLNTIPRAEIFVQPVSGDGFCWSIYSDSWEFKHSIQSLPSEFSDATVFKRLLNYHHLATTFGHTKIGAGEYYIVSAPSLGIDLHRFNPFLPYSLVSHDSYDESHPGFLGDLDNAIINFFWNWNYGATIFTGNLYIDEFHIDSWDRKVKNDAILLSIFGRHNFSNSTKIRFPFTVESAFSVGNPNFGQHKGPFTAANSASFPLFTGSPGMKSLGFLKVLLHTSNYTTFTFSFHKEEWIRISSLATRDVNLKAALSKLPNKRDSRLTITFQRKIRTFNAIINIGVWSQVNDGNKSGANVSLIYNYNP